MRLITGCNDGYLPRMTPYLDSLRAFADLPVTLVGVGFMPPAIEGVDSVLISRWQNAGAPPETECIQHGSFLHVVDGPEDEVLIYTDGDFIQQRHMDDGERDLLALKHGEVVTSWNGGAGETLTLEALRLGMRDTMGGLRSEWGAQIFQWSIYNVGFLAMTRATWRELHAAYMADWERVGQSFTHPARQQWLISYTIQRLGYAVKIAPWSLHAHGHFGLKPGMHYGPGGLWADGKLALMRHHA